MDIKRDGATDSHYRADTGRTYYAVSWPYGRGWTTGDPSNTRAACSPIAFASRQDRDEWCAAGSCYTGESGYREAVTLRTLPYGWSRARFVSAALEAADSVAVCY